MRSTEYLFRGKDRRDAGPALVAQFAQTGRSGHGRRWLAVPMHVPNSRALALHKSWLSALSERELLKKPRDLAQARAVPQLVVDDMLHLSFASTLTSLHGDVRKMLPVLMPRVWVRPRHPLHRRGHSSSIFACRRFFCRAGLWWPQHPMVGGFLARCLFCPPRPSMPG